MSNTKDAVQLTFFEACLLGLENPNNQSEHHIRVIFPIPETHSFDSKTNNGEVMVDGDMHIELEYKLIDNSSGIPNALNEILYFDEGVFTDNDLQNVVGFHLVVSDQNGDKKKMKIPKSTIKGRPN